MRREDLDRLANDLDEVRARLLQMKSSHGASDMAKELADLRNDLQLLRDARPDTLRLRHDDITPPAA